MNGDIVAVVVSIGLLAAAIAVITISVVRIETRVCRLEASATVRCLELTAEGK